MRSMMTMDIPACNQTWTAHNANCQDLGRAAVSSADTAKWDEGSFREAVETAGINIVKTEGEGEGKRDQSVILVLKASYLVDGRIGRWMGDKMD